LKRILADAGLRAAQPRYYIFMAIFNALVVAGTVALAIWSPHPAILVLSAVLFGFMITQNGMLGHDVAHRQVFRKGKRVAAAGWFLGNVMMGNSYSWWTRKHNIHHANPNHITEDPDASYPMLAMFPEQKAKRASLAMPIIAVQAYLYPFLAMFIFLTMRSASISVLFDKTTPMRIRQALGMILHWTLVGLLLTQLGGWPEALIFLFVSQIAFSLYMTSVFAPNHKGMKMMDEDEELDFLRTQVFTARNVRGNMFIDYWYGGLNYQIEHHLFPTMPRNRLGDAKPLVEKFCAERGISYHETSVGGSYKEIFQHLRRSSAGESAE
jgi:fatty acid desaturase